MSMFDLKGNSGGSNWNYSDNTKPNYSEMIEGTVVEIDNPQVINFATKQPEFWPDGNAKRNLRLTILKVDGEETKWTFGPKSKGAQACLMALDPNNSRTFVTIEEMLGKAIRVQTKAGVYNAANPRPWAVVLLGEGDVNAVRGLVDLSKQAQPQQAQPVNTQGMPPQLVNAVNNATQAMGYPTQQQAPQQAQKQDWMDQQYAGLYDQDIPF